MANQEQLQRLQHSVQEWNVWKSKYPKEKIDLSGANLRGANLSVTHLHEADPCGADLYAADLRGANLSATSLRAAILSGADLSRVDLHEAQLSGAKLNGADVSNAVQQNTMRLPILTSTRFNFPRMVAPCVTFGN